MDFAKADHNPGVDFIPPVWRRCRIVFLAKILLSHPFTKADHEQKFFAADNVTKTYMKECIHRGLVQGYGGASEATGATAQ